MERKREMEKEKKREMEDDMMSEWDMDEMKTEIDKAAFEEDHDEEEEEYDEDASDELWVDGAAVSSDGKVALTGNSFGDVDIWEINGSLHRRIGSLDHDAKCHGITGGVINCFAFYPRRRDFAFFATYSMVFLWDLHEGCIVREFRAHVDDNPDCVIPDEHVPDDWEPDENLPCVTCLAVSPDGKTLASGSVHNIIRLWNVQIGCCTGVLRGHTGNIRCLRFTSDGKYLMSSASDRTIRVWNVATYKCVKRYTNLPNSVTEMSFVPGSRLVLLCARNSVYLLDLETGRYKMNGEPFPSRVNSIDICPTDSRLYCVGAASSGIHVRYVANGRPANGQLVDGPSGSRRMPICSACDIPDTGAVFVRWTPDGKNIVRTLDESDLDLRAFHRHEPKRSNDTAKK